MARGAAARRLDFEVQTVPVERPARRDLGVTPKPAVLHGPQKYAELELKRRRAQIRARKALGLI